MSSKACRCPVCGVATVGKPKRSFGSKLARNTLKKGKGAAIGATIGSVIPGLGTITKEIAGAAVKSLIGEKANENIDNFADNFFQDTEFEFQCKSCSHKWTRKY